MELMFQPLKKYAQFDGRARRKEYWLFWLFVVIASGAAGVVDVVLFRDPELQPVGTLLGLAVLCPTLAVGARRLHDIDRSAWWLLLWLIPILGWVVLLVFMLLPGTPGPNRFGLDPKQDAKAEAEVFS